MTLSNFQFNTRFNLYMGAVTLLLTITSEAQAWNDVICWAKCNHTKADSCTPKCKTECKKSKCKIALEEQDKENTLKPFKDEDCPDGAAVKEKIVQGIISEKTSNVILEFPGKDKFLRPTNIISKQSDIIKNSTTPAIIKAGRDGAFRICTYTFKYKEKNVDFNIFSCGYPDPKGMTCPEAELQSPKLQAAKKTAPKISEEMHQNLPELIEIEPDAPSSLGVIHEEGSMKK